MAAVPLWRVCRVAANRVRLRMLLVLNRHRNLRVGDLAKAVNISLPAASQYLRALETCGFVQARRIRRTVVYELAAYHKEASKSALVQPLMTRLITGEKSIEAVFKLATAFASPGRIEVFRSLNGRAKSLPDLKSEMVWSYWTLSRHLKKLESRGFVHRRKEDRNYARAPVADPFGRALAAAAINS